MSNLLTVGGPFSHSGMHWKEEICKLSEKKWDREEEATKNSQMVLDNGFLIIFLANNGGLKGN